MTKHSTPSAFDGHGTDEDTGRWPPGQYRTPRRGPDYCSVRVFFWQLLFFGLLLAFVFFAYTVGELSGAQLLVAVLASLLVWVITGTSRWGGA